MTGTGVSGKIHAHIVNTDRKYQNMSKYSPNASEEDKKLGIIHSTNGYWVSNEGTEDSPLYHVWVPSGNYTHTTSDVSAYEDITLAVARCNYLAEKANS